MKLRSCTLLCALGALLPAALPSCMTITTERVASGLANPLYVTAPAGDTGRLFIVERDGVIKILNLNTQAISTFLDVSDLVSTTSEQGLLCMAFSPNYQTNGLFYVHYTGVSDGATNIVEYRVSSGNPNVADPASARLVLRFAQPQANHNGGWIGFDTNGSLFIASGDGGGSDDNDAGHTADIGNAQDIEDNLLGKLLAIDPGSDEFPMDADRNYAIPPQNPFVGAVGDDEIWAYGLRNPWRCSFDRQTGDLWIGDVGQGAREEIDFAPASSTGGENYGWRLREGFIETPSGPVGGPKPPGNVDPIYDYTRGSGQFQGRSVTGGYVYRGPIVDLQGKYFFGDYINQKVWSITRSGTTFTDLSDWTVKFVPDVGTIDSVASFGEDAVGNLYIIDFDGEIFRVVKKFKFGGMGSALQTTVARVIGRR